MHVQAKTRKIDSLEICLLKTRTDTLKINLMNKLASEYQSLSADTALLYSLQAYKMSEKINYLRGIILSTEVIGLVYLDAGNYSKALETFIEKLKAVEKGRDAQAVAIISMQIANTYQQEGDYNQAFDYGFRADSIINSIDSLSWLKPYSLINLGDLYEKTGKLSSAIEYTKMAYTIAIKKDDVRFKGIALNNLGNIYSRSGNINAAIQSYKEALPFLETVNESSFITESTLGLARQYHLLKKNDSALLFGLRSYTVSNDNGFLDKKLNVCVFLTQYFKDIKDIKKAFEFQEEVLLLKDSIFSKEKVAKTQLLTIEEEIRQKELAEKLREAAEERRIKLQYLTIALLLPIFFFITVYLSNRKIKPKYVEFLGIVSLLLTFEYIMLLLHPVIVKITNHLPLYQLMIFALIASVLTPLHHRIENWLLKLLSKKEKISLIKIRIQ